MEALAVAAAITGILASLIGIAASSIVIWGSYRRSRREQEPPIPPPLPANTRRRKLRTTRTLTVIVFSFVALVSLLIVVTFIIATRSRSVNAKPVPRVYLQEIQATDPHFGRDVESTSVVKTLPPRSQSEPA